MRWDDLFEDLEARWDEMQWRQTLDQSVELVRGEWAAVPLADRLRGALGVDLRLHLAWGAVRDVRLTQVGEDWAAAASTGGSLLLPLSTVTACEGPLASAVSPSGAAARTGLGAPLRRLSRARAGVRLVGRGGAVIAEGTIERVGLDHLDLAAHARDEGPRRGSVRRRVVVPFTSLGLVEAPRP